MSSLVRTLFVLGIFALATEAAFSSDASLDSSPESSPEYDWQFIKEELGVKVYTAAVTGSKYKIFKGVTILDTSMASVLGVLSDTPACSEWLHLCRHSETLEFTSFNRRIIYQVNNLPFPVRDRDLVVLATTSYQADTGSFVLTLESKPDLYPLKKPIRIRLSYGSYTLIPIAKEQIKVVWEHFADPAGSIPSLLVNALVVDIPLHSLVNLKKLVTEQKYQSLQIDFDDHGIPVGLIDSRTGKSVMGKVSED